jgi:hypothetical protein
MKLEQVRSLRAGSMLYSTLHTNVSDGLPQRFRVTSVKTWKTRPTEIRIKATRGLYTYITITQNDLSDFEISQQAAILRRDATILQRKGILPHYAQQS